MTQRADQAWMQTRDVVNALRKSRKDQGLSQKDLADRLGLVQATVAQFESDYSDPKISTIQRYAQALGISIRFTMEVDDEQADDGSADQGEASDQEAARDAAGEGRRSQ